MGSRRMLDFSRAYEKRYGSLPKPLIEGQKGRKIGEVRLEGLAPGTLLRAQVSPNDMISIKAGNSVFKVVFQGVDREGGLAFECYDNSRYEGGHSLASQESCTLWRGTRMDFSSFKVSMRRLPGKGLQVELSAHFERFIEVG